MADDEQSSRDRHDRWLDERAEQAREAQRADNSEHVRQLRITKVLAGGGAR